MLKVAFVHTAKLYAKCSRFQRGKHEGGTRCLAHVLISSIDHVVTGIGRAARTSKAELPRWLPPSPPQIQGLCATNTNAGSILLVHRTFIRLHFKKGLRTTRLRGVLRSGDIVISISGDDRGLSMTSQRSQDQQSIITMTEAP